MKGKIRCMVIAVFILAACTSGIDRNTPSTYLGKKMLLPEAVEKLSLADSRIVVPVHVDTCRSCDLKNLMFWEHALTVFSDLKSSSEQSLDIVFVLSTQEDDLTEQYIAPLRELYPIIVYYDSSAELENGFVLPVDYQYNCFLLDRNDVIQLIGCPMFSDELLKKYISKIIHQSK